jgi:hypothetical protein
MKKIKIILLLVVFGFYGIQAQHLIESDIWLSDVRIKEGNIYFGAARKITKKVGYNSQPFFLNDTTLLYTHIGEDFQADIYQHRTKSKTNSQFTDTKLSEYTPKLLPNRKGISVVEVEQDSTQRIWSYDLTGSNGKVYVPMVDSVGYYTWLNDTSFAAFILTEPPSLQICNSSNDKTKTIATNIGRCLQVSSFGNLYFTRLEKDSVRWLCRTEINGSITKLIEFYKGVEDFVISNNNTIFCCKDGMIYYSDNQFNLGWRLCGNFGTSGVNNINRMALSPDNKQIALVNLTEPKK